MKHSSNKPVQAGYVQHPVVICLAIIGLVYGLFQLLPSHASAAVSSDITSGTGYCLDVRDNSSKPAAIVDSWTCNHSQAQNWNFTAGKVIHAGKACLTATGGHLLVAAACDDSAGQVWLADKTGLLNPESGLCLAVPDSKAGQQLELAACSQSATPNETWLYKSSYQPDDAAAACAGVSAEGQRVACVAEQEWAIWQSGSLSHTYLLNKYTDGDASEEWCADFVSYVYKQAGYPFTAGESDGWDENIAANIQNMGFTLHPAGSYVPQPGDVAFFDYPGGHVEIVISGGKTPTFIYGNSDTIDPTTGNGEMAANTITKDGDGQLLYYLSPDED